MITASQVTAGTAPVSFCTVPPGPCQVVFSNAGTTTVYAAPGTAASAVSASNGFPIPAGTVLPPFGVLPGGGGADFYVVTSSGSAEAGFLISAP